MEGLVVTRSFFIDDDRIVFIANAGADLRYRAHAHRLPPGMQVPTRRNERSSLVFVLETGTLEFMVEGAVGCIRAGELVRIAPGASFAYRNIGNSEALLLSRCQAPTRPVRRVTVEVAA